MGTRPVRIGPVGIGAVRIGLMIVGPKRCNPGMGLSNRFGPAGTSR